MSKALFADGKPVDVVALSDWLNWCSGNSSEQKIVLPLIQRGSVWKPAQVLDLWDSLLRGMPVGSLMLNKMEPVTDKVIRVRLPGRKDLEELKGTAFGLLDGQQRTLAMLVGWPKNNLPMDRLLWVDFADVPSGEHLFRLRLTTENHPFGFQRNSPSAKLSMDDRRRAKLIYLKQQGISEANCKFPDFQNSFPYHSGKCLPVEMSRLISWYLENKNFDIWKQNVIDHEFSKVIQYTIEKDKDGKLEAVSSKGFTTSDILNEQIVQSGLERMYKSLETLLQQFLPLLHVDVAKIEGVVAKEGEDPALAILFKRVGSNGTNLSNEDYVFSVIKHYCPETYELVEKLGDYKSARLPEYALSSLLQPVDIVSTAVRLAMAQCKSEKGAELTDVETIDKNRFQKLLQENILVDGVDGESEFLRSAFLPLLKEEGKLNLFYLFDEMAELLAYKNDSLNDIGLPPHAVWLLKRPLIQVILLWIMMAQKNNCVTADIPLSTMREDLIRFVLFWSLCVTNPAKASHFSFEYIKRHQKVCAEKLFFKKLYLALSEEGVALSLFSPDKLFTTVPKIVKTNMNSPEYGTKPLRGWKRFQPKADETNDEEKARALYEKWWRNNSSYQHTLLLWLQREYVSNLPGSPLAGREEDTPFDYDHILPQAHWYENPKTGDNRILDYMNNDGAHYYLGNSIGNVRVWSSADNRSDGSAPPREKFSGDDTAEKLKNSLIDEENYKLWLVCSEYKDNLKHWSLRRAQSFQEAVEYRTFALYKKFFNDLKFNEWVL